MNTLSDPQQTDGNTQVQPQPVGSVSSGNKEVVVGSGHDVLHDASGQEFEIPKEVASAGVRIHPTTVPIPPRVSHMGMKPAGANIPVQTTTTVALPLTDDQIAVGLTQGVVFSWRWFSEWCVRRMKQIHVAVKMVHGKLIRVKV